MDLAYHPLFDRWLVRLIEGNPDVGGEVMALLAALEKHGMGLGDPESHPVATSTSRLRALRRTPPTSVTPYAEGPPVLRILYGFAVPPGGGTRAVVLYGGDKSTRSNRWYPPATAEAERRLGDFCRRMGWRIVKLRMEDP